MKRTFMAIMLGTLILPASGFAHDPYYRDSYGWRDRIDRRIARPVDPGNYCHRHRRDGRLHCHSVYNDPHGIAAERAYPFRWSRR